MTQFHRINNYWLLVKLILCTGILLFCSTLHAIEIHVAPNGNDSNDGSIDRPLQTLEAAKNMARQEKNNDSVQVLFHAGTYPVTRRVTFSQADSGTSSSPIVYRAFENDTAFFDGLLKLNAADFSPVSGALSQRLHPSARGRAWSTVIRDAQTIALLKNEEAGLSFNNRMLLTTASPNKGFYHVKRIYAKGTGSGTHSDPKGGSFDFHENIDFALFRKEIERGGKQAIIRGYMTSAWKYERGVIQRFGGTGSKVIVLKDKLAYDFHISHTPRFRIKNMLATMDIDREWFFDQNDNRLYFIPPNGQMNAHDTIGIWAGPEAILVNGANHLSFENIVFQHLAGC